MTELRPVLLIAALVLGAPACTQQSTDAELFAKTFDTHWKRLRDDYPYFELYGVDWEAERQHHRPLAIAANSPTEFAWEMARMIAALPDPHVWFMPAVSTMKDKWSVPDLKTALIQRRPYVVTWPEGITGDRPAAFVGDDLAFPEIIGVCGELPSDAAAILVAGPLGSSASLRLRWPDGTETEHELQRPTESNLPPPNKHYGEGWLTVGRAGDVGYVRIRTFDPKKATLGPDGKMTTMLRAALRELADTDSLILDLQGNGGGLVAASDPFLGNIVGKRLSYAWGRSGGKKRVITPRSPRYRGPVVALVDQHSASGGEWAARILRDAGRATVVGERTAGAEAAVHDSDGPDGSKLTFSAWPMVEPGREPFQQVGITLDHDIPLTIENVREHGLDEARRRVQRRRIAKALEVLQGDAALVDQLIELSAQGDARAAQDDSHEPRSGPRR